MTTTLTAIDYKSKNAAWRFVKSLHETGFGVLKNHPISQIMVRGIYENWHAFFTTGDKSGLLFNPDTQDGYFPAESAETAKGHHTRDLKEYFHYYPDGRCPEHLLAQIKDYYTKTSALAEEILGWVEAHSPPDIAAAYSQPLSSMAKNSPKTLLRILHYPPLHSDEKSSAIRAAAHEDINLLTILPAANEPGLQILAKDGNWLDVPCDFGNLIVNIGDMLQEASRGYFPSTTHRVINPEGIDMCKSRLSLPLFLHPHPDVILSDRHTAESYLTERLQDMGMIDQIQRSQ